MIRNLKKRLKKAKKHLSEQDYLLLNQAIEEVILYSEKKGYLAGSNDCHKAVVEVLSKDKTI